MNVRREVEENLRHLCQLALQRIDYLDLPRLRIAAQLPDMGNADRPVAIVTRLNILIIIIYYSHPAWCALALRSHIKAPPICDWSTPFTRTVLCAEVPRK